MKTEDGDVQANMVKTHIKMRDAASGVASARARRANAVADYLARLGAESHDFSGGRYIGQGWHVEAASVAFVWGIKDTPDFTAQEELGLGVVSEGALWEGFGPLAAHLPSMSSFGCKWVGMPRGA